MYLKKTAFLTALALAVMTLTGCATSGLTPKEFPAKALTSERTALEDMQNTWNSASAEREGKASMVLITPFSVPKSVKDEPIQLELESGASVKDLVAILGRKLEHSIILADEDAGKATFYLPYYKGTVGGLLSAVSRATNVWFTWSDGTIAVSSTEKISLTLPQEETLGQKIMDGLTALGFEKVATSWEAGMVTLSVTPTELAKVRAYLQRMTSNAALVSLQVAIVNVQMTQDAKQGVDWTKLQLAVGRNYAPSGIQTLDGFRPTAKTSSFVDPKGSASSSSTSTSTSSSSTNASTSSATDPDYLSQSLSAVGMASGGLKGIITNSAFSFTGLFDFLQTYGTTDTKQNVILKSVAGTVVELKSLTQTPYVESISVTSTGTSGTGGNGNTMGSAKTAKADDGLILKMTPFYDAAANTVTVKLDLALKAVLGFNNLSAGNQIGQLTQPTTAERSFNDVLRVRPGQTVVVGGITYDSVARTGNAPIAMGQDSSFDHKGLTVARNSMFIVVRPTVVSLGQVTEDAGPELFAPGQVAEPVAKAKNSPAVVELVKKDLPTGDASEPKTALLSKNSITQEIPNKVPESKATVLPAITTETSAVLPSDLSVASKPELVSKALDTSLPTTKAVYDENGYTSVPLRAKD